MKARELIIISLLLVAFVTVGLCVGSQSAKSPSEKCGDCHSDSLVYKEWQTSGHASAMETLLKDPDARQSCLKCHSADYNRVRFNPWLSIGDLPKPEAAGNAVSCSACHKHGIGQEKNLIMKVDKLCTFCHVLYCGG